jgi:hypothetical protein
LALLIGQIMAHSNHLVAAWIPRFSAGVTATFMLGVLAGLPAWILLLLLPDFVARAADRRALAPTTWVAIRLIAPRLGPAALRRHTEWAPKRFAARVGLAAVVAVLAGYVAAPATAAGPALAAVMLTLCGLEALAGVCVACRTYTGLSRLHLVRGCPGGVCDVLTDEVD